MKEWKPPGEMRTIELAESRPDTSFNKREARKQSQVKFKLHHRGKSKISFPLDAGRALIKITGAKSVNKAIASWMYAESFRLRNLHHDLEAKIQDRARRHFNEFFEHGGVDKEQFRKAALIFIEVRRPGIDIDKHRKRIFKLFLGLGISVDHPKLAPYS